MAFSYASMVPGLGFIGPDTYNVLVTMHGTTMVFFVAMPMLLGAFGNFLIPLMIGARDMAFPRLNMLSFWTIFTGSLVLLVSFVVPGGAAAGGWTGYAPLSARPIYSGVNWGLNLWLLAHAIEFASFLMGGVNFLTTAMTMRAPGMTFFRIPILVWQQLTAVHREFQGHGIAAALKLRTIAYARMHGFREIRTFNSSRNEPMLAINTKLGFIRQPAWIDFLLEPAQR